VPVRHTTPDRCGSRQNSGSNPDLNPRRSTTVTVSQLNHRTVLDAIAHTGATEPQIADALAVPGSSTRVLERRGVAAHQLHHLLTRLVIGGLATMRVENRAWQYRLTALARRMAGADEQALAQQITDRLSWK
jgi:hypothetical protein